jgi:hypothetical protein
VCQGAIRKMEKGDRALEVRAPWPAQVVEMPINEPTA